MRVIFHDRFDFVTLRTANGRPRAMVSYKPSPEPLTVKKDHGEAAVEAGKAEEVKDVARREDMTKIAKQVAERDAVTHGTVELTDAPK